MNLEHSIAVPPRWLYFLAVLTVAFTVPLLFLGAGVTSHDVGMVDPRGFRPPWEIISGLLERSDLGWRLEYGHRTFGFLVGVSAILLTLGCWFFDSRPRMGWLALLALGLIAAQGVLGILRVDLNALFGRGFALIHGCFAQIVFALLVCNALLLSRRWSSDQDEEPLSPAVQRASIATVLIVFAQLLLGAVVRHNEATLGPRGHLLGAFVVVGALVWLLKVIRESEGRERFRVQRILLMIFLTVQLFLGVESWLAKFAVAGANFPQLEPAPMHAEWIRTLHYLVGAFLFSTTVVVALIANRKWACVAEPQAVRRHELEGAI